jgi:hypothetical protein
MSDSNDTPNAPDSELLKHEMEAEVELLAELLAHEFSAIERAAEKVRAKSEMAKKLVELDLLHILSKLRLSRAMDDFTSIYLDLKDEEAEAARELLEELGDDDEFDDFEDDEFEDEFDDFGDLDADDEDDEDDDAS